MSSSTRAGKRHILVSARPSTSAQLASSEPRNTQSIHGDNGSGTCERNSGSPAESIGIDASPSPTVSQSRRLRRITPRIPFSLAGFQALASRHESRLYKPIAIQMHAKAKARRGVSGSP